MSWLDILSKANSPMLDKADPKQKKKIMNKSKPMQKKMEEMAERNTDLVARAAELRKDYEILYRQLRGMVYPKSKGDLGEEKDE